MEFLFVRIYAPLPILLVIMRSPFAVFSISFSRRSIGKLAWKFASGRDVGYEVHSLSMLKDFPSPLYREGKSSCTLEERISNLAKTLANTIVPTIILPVGWGEGLGLPDVMGDPRHLPGNALFNNPHNHSTTTTGNAGLVVFD